MPSIPELAARNLDTLRKNPYPGRGIVQGLSTSGDFAQVYWLMGRSENSRGRRLRESPDGSGIVSTEPFGLSVVQNPDLIIYNAMRVGDGAFIVSNGNHTDQIADRYNNPDFANLHNALNDATYEPDAPNYTPRIAGVYDSLNESYDFEKIYKDPLASPTGPDLNADIHVPYEYVNGVMGYGRVLHTYNGDGNPLPFFDQDPYIVPLEGNADQIAQTYWDVLNTDNKVALAVRTIQTRDSSFRTVIINKH